MTARVVDRNIVVQRLGTPNETIGSVNEPREIEEQGHRFNEKWIYRLVQPRPEEPAQRWVYWLRYDFVASYLIGGSGEPRREDLGTVLSGVADRRFHPEAPERRER